MPGWTSTPSGLTSIGVGNLTISGNTIASTTGITLQPTDSNGVGVMGGNLGITNGYALLLYEATDTYYAGFKATAATANSLYVMPPTLPVVNAFLETDSSGNLSWQATTGSGAVVLATSPVLTTPTLGAALATSVQLGNNGLLDVNGNEILKLSAVSSAVNYLKAVNNITGASPALQVDGSDTNIRMLLTSKGNLGVAIMGTAAADNASSGYVGEIISSVILSSSAVNIPTAAATNLTTISLTAGDWDIYGNVTIIPSVNVNQFFCWVSLTLRFQMGHTMLVEIL